MKYIYILFTLLLLSTQVAYAQPANDDCSNAESVTPDGSCVSGTTVAAIDDWSGTVGCQSGSPNSHEDVWYSFVATGTQVSIDATATGGWTGDVEIILVDGTCGGFSLLDATCGVSPQNLSYSGLTVGITYYYTISNDASGTNGTFDVCTNNTTPPPGCTDNDLCSAPQVLVLTTGVQSCLTDCNTGASSGPNFAGSICEDMLNPTVWYEVTTGGSDVTMDITLNSAVFSDPEFVVFQSTDCATYTFINCTEGTGGSAAANFTVSPSSTYLIAVSDATGDEGNFDLCVTVDIDNSPCNTNSAITATATSMGSPLGGPYLQGEVVSFCYSITDWQTGASCNYLGGIVPTFGNGWDAASFDVNGMPVSIPTPLVTAGIIQPGAPGPPVPWAACVGETAGTWSWFNAGDVLYNDLLANTGSPGALPDGTPLPAGWFFLTSYDPVTTNACSPDPTDPDASFGDNSFPGCDNTLDWSVCFDLTVGPIANCSGGLTDLTVSMQTYSDGETGAWNSVGCVGNIAQVSPGIMSCCLATATVSGGGSYCQGVSPTGVDVHFDFTGDGPWSLTYEVDGVPTTIATASNPYIIIDALVGTYIPTVISDINCTGTFSGSATVTETPLDDATFSYALVSYCQDAVDPTAAITGTPGGAFSSTAGIILSSGTGLIDVSASTVGPYTVTYLTGGTCPAFTTFAVDIDAVDDPTFNYALASYCQNGVDPTPTISGTAGGTFSAGVGLVINVGTGLIDVSASTVGPYTVTYLTGGTCSASTTFGITIVAVDDPSFTYGAAAYCQDASDPTPTITGTAGGTFSAAAGLSISPGTGLIDVSVSTVGSYTVTYLTGGTCPAFTTFVVDIDAVDDPTFNYALASYCQNGVDPTPTISGAAGGTFSAGAGLVIIAGTGVVDLSASTPGVYTVTYLTSGTCPAFTTFGLTIVLAEDASFTYPAGIYCQNGVGPTPTITGTLGGTFSAGVGLSISAGTGVIDLSASTAGPYTVTYLTGGACSESATFGITIVAMDDASFNYSSGTFCLTSTDPTPIITGTLGGTFTGTGSLVITPGTGLIDLGLSGVGAYTVTYTTGGVCPTSLDFPLSITSSPDATFNYDWTPYCEGASTATVTFGAGASGGDFTSTVGLVLNIGTGEVDLATSTPGTYTVDNDILAAGGCAAAFASTSIVISPAEDPTFTYSSSAYCQDDINPSATISGTGGGTFTALAGLSITAGTGLIDLASSTTGTYDVTYTTPGICFAASIVSVTINTVDDATFSYTTTSYCQGGIDPTPTVSGTPGGGYTSTAGLSIDAVSGVIDLAGSITGPYAVTYTTVGTCPALSIFNVDVLAVDDPSFTYTSATYCQDSSNQLPTVTGTIGGTFSSTIGLSIIAGTGEIDLVASTAGAYDVTYLTGGTCPDSTTFSVTITAVDDPSFTYAFATYCQDGINPTPTITGVVGGMFSSTVGLSITGVTGVIDLVGSIIGTYVVTYTTTGACPTSTTFNLDVVGVDDPSFTYSSATYCQNETNPIPTISGTAGGAFSSSVGILLNSGTGEINLAASSPGSYDIMYLTNGTCPDSTTFSITVTAVDDASFTYTSNAFCMADPNPIASITGTLGGGFSINLGGTINALTGEIDVNASGAGTYTVYYTTVGICPAIDSLGITITNQLDATITLASPYCSDEVVDTLIAANSGGTWSGNGVNAITGEFDPAAAGPGTWSILYTLGGGCGDVDSINVVVTQSQQAIISPAGPYCTDDVSEFLTVDTVGGTWSGTGVDILTGEFDPVVAGMGTWEVIYSPIGSCLSNDTTQLVVVQTPIADAGVDVTIVSGGSTTLNGTGGGTYIWSPVTDLSCTVCQNPIANPLVTTTYLLTVNSATCVDSDSVTVTVTEIEDNQFFVPNIFSPNGDGNNDVFLVEGSGLTDFNLKIFNRWGEIIFESIDQSNGWDGTQNGEQLNAAVFVYLISYVDSNAEEQVITGNVTLLK